MTVISTVSEWKKDCIEVWSLCCRQSINFLEAVHKMMLSQRHLECIDRLRLLNFINITLKKLL